MVKRVALQEVLDEAIKEREELRAKLEEVSRLIEFLERRITASGKPASPAVGIKEEMRTQRFKAMSAPKAAEIVLRENGKPMHLEKVSREIIKGGYTDQLDPKRLYLNLFSTLKRMADKGRVFKKDNRPAMFGLVEWDSQLEMRVR